MMASARVSVPARTSRPQDTVTIRGSRGSYAAPSEFREFVLGHGKRRGYRTLAEIARAAGVDSGALSRWVGGNNGATVGSLRQLSAALEVDILDMMVAAGMLQADEIDRPVPPPELQQFLDTWENPDGEYSEQEIQGLLAGADFSFQQWKRLMTMVRESPREPRARRR